VDFRKALASNVAMLRKEHKLTRVQLGDILGVKQQSIEKIEKGENAPSFDTLMMLACYFDCSVDFLIGRTDKRNFHKA